MRPSSPRSSRSSSTTARYSASSSRVRSSVGMPSFRSSTSTSRRPCASVSAAPAMPRCSPSIATAVAPPGSRTRSVTRATVPTAAYSPSCFGTSSTRSSSPTSTVRVTFMWGKTTMSSSGTSSSLVTVPITLLGGSRYRKYTYYRTYYGGNPDPPRTETSQTLRKLPLEYEGGKSVIPNRLPWDLRTGDGRALRGRNRPAARAPSGALAPRRRRTASAAEASQRRLSEPAREDVRACAGARAVVGHDSGHEDAAVPDDEAGVVARGIDPTCLVQDDRPGPALHEAAELAAVAHVRQYVQEVARLCGADARAATRERAEPAPCQPDGAEQESEISRGGRLADAPRRLIDHVEGHAPGGDLPRRIEGGSEDVAAVHHGLLQPDGTHHAVDEVPAAARRAAERDQQPVCRLVVRRVEHPAQEAVDVASGPGWAVDPGEHRDRDRELERRSCGKRRARVPRGACTRTEILDVCSGRAAEAAGEAPNVPLERGIGSQQADVRPCRARQPEDVPHRPPAATSCGVDGLDAHAHLPRRQIELEPELAAGEAQLARDRAVHPDDHALRATCGPSLDDAVRHLVRSRPLDHGRRKCGCPRRGVDHGRTVALTAPCRYSPIWISTPSSLPWRSSRIRRCGRGRSSSEVTRTVAGSSPPRTTSRGGSASARR